MGRKRKSTDEVTGGGTFMMMFVTLSLLLLAFFILLNSMAVLDSRKQRMAVGSLFGSFGILPGGDSTDEGREAKNNTSNVFDGDSLQQLFKQAREDLDQILTNNKIDAGPSGITFDEQTGEIKIILAERLLFQATEAVIALNLFPFLDNIARIARKTGGRVVVTGHTDDRKPKGGPNNWQLSLARGVLVARHLEAVGSLPKGQVYASGMSHYKPIADYNTAEGRAANRRVEIYIRTEDIGIR